MITDKQIKAATEAYFSAGPSSLNSNLSLSDHCMRAALEAAEREAEQTGNDETAAAELRTRLSAAEAERDAAMAELRRNRPYPDTAIAVLTQPPPSTKGMAPRDRADRLYAAWLEQVARGLATLTPSPEGDEG
jgi:hypothetical protein